MLTEERSRIGTGLRYVHAFGSGVFILFLATVIITTFVATLYTVDGHSMEPTLQDGQHVGVNLLAYRFADPQRNDIVIVAYQGDVSVRFVKRIVGVPGDVVPVGGNNVKLAEDEFYVVGDNKDHSTDSRVYGPIKRDHIIGKVFTQQ